MDAATAAPENPAPASESAAEIEQWVRVAAQAADEKLGQRPVAFEVGPVLAITDWFLVTSGSNPRQVRAIVENIEEEISTAGGPKPRTIEGMDTGTWVLVDYGIFIAHVFTEEAREYYELERLWKDVPRLDLQLPTHPEFGSANAEPAVGGE